MVLLIKDFIAKSNAATNISALFEQRLHIYPHFKIIKFSLCWSNDAVTSQRKHTENEHFSKCYAQETASPLNGLASTFLHTTISSDTQDRHINDASRQNLVQLHQEPHSIFSSHTDTQTERERDMQAPNTNFTLKHLTFCQRKLSKRDFVEPKNMFADFRSSIIDWTIALASQQHLSFLHSRPFRSNVMALLGGFFSWLENSIVRKCILLCK